MVAFCPFIPCIDEDHALIALIMFLGPFERSFQPGLVGLRTALVKNGGIGRSTRAVVKTRAHAANKGIGWIGLGHDAVNHDLVIVHVMLRERLGQ